MTLTPNQRIELIELIETGISIAEACRFFNVSRTTGYKWLNRFYEYGIDGLNDKSSKPDHSPSKISDDIKKIILTMSSNFPHFGANKLSSQLKNEKISISPPTIQKVLIEYSLGSQRERFLSALESFREKPNSTSLATLEGMERISKNSKYRKYFTNKPGKRIFAWHEFCKMKKSNKNIPYFIFLDMNGLVVSIFSPPGILHRKSRMKPPLYAREKIGTLRITYPTVKINSMIYEANDLRITDLIIPSPKNMNISLSDVILEELGIKTITLEHDVFFGLPFIRDVKFLTKKFIKDPVSGLTFKNPLESTIYMLTHMITFVTYCNMININSEYPLLGMTPIEFLLKDFYANIIDDSIKLIDTPLRKKIKIYRKLLLFRAGQSF